MDRKLTPPPALDPVQNAIDHCELMIEESIENQLAIRDGRPAPHQPSHLGGEYDDAYAQGRKDSCRVILITLREREHITSDDVRRQRGST